MPQCTATSKQSGNRCKRHATPGMTVCAIHGGKSKRGIESATFVHGRYSKVVPERLSARFRELMADPDYLSLQGEIALITTRLSDLLQDVDAGLHSKLWRDALNAYSEFYTLFLAKKYADMLEPLEQLRAILTAGADSARAWAEIDRLVNSRRKLVDSERRRIVDAQQILTTEQAMALASIVLDAVNTYVSNPDERAAIKAALARVMA